MAFDTSTISYNPISNHVETSSTTDNGVKLSPDQISKLPPEVMNTLKTSGSASYVLPNYNIQQTGAPLASSLINTSSQSRTNYTNNVNTLNGANSSISTGGGTTSTLPKPGTQTAVYGADGNLAGYTQADGSFTNVKTGKNTPAAGDKNDTQESNDNGLDPSIKQQYQDNINSAQDEIDYAKGILDSATATMQNDPAMIAAAGRIKNSYDILIKQMEAKNNIISGRNAVSMARYGGGGVMTQDFISSEMDRATARIGDLVTKENDAIVKSNQAYKDGEVKAFNAAMKEYKTAVKDKQTAITDLGKAIDTKVKENQAQAKIDAKAANDEIANNIKVSAALGKTMASAIKESGVTDTKKIDEYVNAMAAANGITNPDVLKSALVKAQQDAKALDLKTENTNDTIKNRDKDTDIKQQNANTAKERARIAAEKKKISGNNPKFVISEGIKKVTPQMATEAKKGTDGFIDPEKWMAARTNWQSLGGSEASFKSNFIKYLNPESYTKAGYKAPKAGAGGFK